MKQLINEIIKTTEKLEQLESQMFISGYTREDRKKLNDAIDNGIDVAAKLAQKTYDIR